MLTKQEEIVSSDKSALEITLESTPKPETIKTEETVDITVKEDKGVSEAPRFTKTLHRQFEATEGSSVTIECEVTGKETPVVTWYQDERQPPLNIENLSIVWCKEILIQNGTH